MATVTGLTAARMLAIEAQSIVDGVVDENGHLKLTTFGGAVIDAGKVKGDKGESGTVGPAGPVSQPSPEPVAPAGLTVTSNTAYHTAAGQPMATVVFEWPVPTLDVIGDIPAIDLYELWYREASATNAIILATSEINSATVLTLAPGEDFRVKVRAHTFQGHWGEFSTEINVTPAVPASDVPQPPTNVAIVSNNGGFAPDGRAEATINLTWDAVTESVDFFPIGIQTYEVWTLNSVGDYTPMLQTPETSVFMTVPSGIVVELSVRAMSKYGVWSGFSESDVVTTDFPPQNNTPASTPILSSSLGIVFAEWDGNLTTGPVGPEFQHLITEFATSETGPWTPVGIPAVSSGMAAQVASTPGTQHWARFRWRDRLGRLSEGISSVATAVTVGIEHEDLSDDMQAAFDAIEGAVVSITAEYAVGSSDTVAPTTGWSTATPARTPGTYVWMRTTTTYADASVVVANPVMITGNDGASGGSGTPGVGISGTTVMYQVHTSGTTAPTGTWVASPPATVTGQFLWTRTITTYTNATSTTAYSVSAHGATGATGSAGVGIASTGITYQAHTNGTTAPTGTWLASPPAVPAGQYLWTRTFITYTDASNSTSYAVSKQGDTGGTGSPGANGQTSYFHVAYATNATGTAGFSTTDPSGKTYMGTYSDFTFADSSNPALYEWVKIEGPSGGTGPTGKGIASSAVHYQGSSSGTVVPTGTWVTTVPVVANGDYLWTRTTITFTDAATQISYSTARQGTDGPQGIQGPPGTNGQTLYTWIKYADTPTTGMSDSPTGKTYMGIAYNKASSTESSVYTDYEWSLIVGPQGVPGAPGTDGSPRYTWIKYGTSAAGAGLTDNPTGMDYMGIAYNKVSATESTVPGDYEWSLIQGADGRGISSTAVTYQVHTNGTTAPTGTWLSSPAATAPGQFLWTRTVTTYTDATNSTAYSVSAHGATGSTGAAGKGITATTVTYQVGSSGTTAPTGTWTTTPGATAAGQFLWTRTVIDYTDASSVTVYGVSAHGATGTAGTPGTPGTPGADATTVQVGNDAVAIPTDNAGATTTTHVITIPFSGWVGNTRAAATIAASGLPTGITAGTNTAATSGADGSLILNVASASTLGGTNYGEITLTLVCNSKTFVQKFSWSKAPQGAQGSTGGTGGTGAPGTSATSIDVGNEAVVIPCTSAGLTTGASTITVPFTGYLGNTRVATTVSVSGLPTGITVQTNTAGTSGAAGSLVLAVASGSSLGGTDFGGITLTITANSIAFTQTLSWSKAIAGAAGSTGGTGSPGSPGVDATYATLGNDAVSIPTDASGTTASTFALTVPFAGYIGNSRAAATIAATGLPSGITAGTNTAATTGADGSLILNVASGSTLGGTSAGEITLTVTVNSKAFVYKFSWAKAPAGTAGSAGSAGAAATSVDVGNEAVVIPCTSAGATVGASTITIPFTGFIGATRAAATVVVSGLPTGITVQTNTPGTTGAAGSLILAVASGSTLGGTNFGDITLTITVNSIAFVQLFSWTKGIAGATGSTGGTGSAGKGVSSITPYYMLTATGAAAPAAPTTNPPGGSWTITEPAYTSNTDLWRAEMYVFTDATFGWTVVSKVSSYTASTYAVSVANTATQAAQGLVKMSITDPGHAVGRIWYVLDPVVPGSIIGMKISNGSAWTSYLLMAEQILVPSSLGTISIKDGAITGPTLDVVNIWADNAWLTHLRAGKIETTMITSTLGAEINLGTNEAFITVDQKVLDHTDLIKANGDTLIDTNDDLTKLGKTVGDVDSTATTAKEAAAAAQALADANKIETENLKTWFRVDGLGAHIGQTNNPFQAHMLPGEFNITDDGVKTTYWTSKRMYVPIMDVQQEIIIAQKHKLERYPADPTIPATGTVIKVV